MRSTSSTNRKPRAAKTAAAALATALALSLTACGGGDDKGGDTGATGAKESGTTVTLPKLNGESLEVAAVWSGEEQANFKKVLAEFEKRTGAKVTFVPAQDPIVNFLGSKVAGGKPPDVAMLPQPGAIKQAVDKKWAKPLGAEAKAELAKNYSQGWQDIGKVGGTQYGVYYKAANKSLIWYNAKVFENAGATEPKTWAELLTTAQTVYDSGVTPFSVGGAEGWTLTDWFENVYLSQAGPEVRPVGQARDQVDGPVREGRADHAGPGVGQEGLHRDRRAADGLPGLGDADVHRRRPAQGGDGLRG